MKDFIQWFLLMSLMLFVGVSICYVLREKPPTIIVVKSPQFRIEPPQEPESRPDPEPEPIPDLQLPCDCYTLPGASCHDLDYYGLMYWGKLKQKRFKGIIHDMYERDSDGKKFYYVEVCVDGRSRRSNLRTWIKEDEVEIFK